MRQLGLSLAAGLLSALLFLSIAKGMAFGIVLSYFSPLPLMVVGLGYGMAASVVTGLFGMAAVAMVADGISTLPYLALAGIPAVLVTNRALLWRNGPDGSTEWYPAGLVLAWLTMAGLLMMLIGASILADQTGSVRGWVSMVLTQTLDVVATGLPLDAKLRAVEWWTPFFPAMVAGSWLLMAVINAVLALGILTRMGQARRPRPIYRQIWLPDWLALGMGVAIIGAAIGQDELGYVAVNAAVILGLPFSFLGLAAVHLHVHGRKQAGIILTATYGLLILMSGWAVAALAGLGLVRFWTMRFRRPDSGGGMEG